MVTCPNASFTDLAEIVSRIEPVKPAVVDGKTFVCLCPLVVRHSSPWLTWLSFSLSPLQHLFTHAGFLPVLCSLAPSEESDYHTDYEEEALESALSDMEPYSFCGEHTEGEETGDTVGHASQGGDNVNDQSVCVC